MKISNILYALSNADKLCTLEKKLDVAITERKQAEAKYNDYKQYADGLIARDRRRLSDKLGSLEIALQRVCDRSTLSDEQIYRAVSMTLDPDGWALYHAAETVTKINVEDEFPTETQLHYFEGESDVCTRYLEAAYFKCVSWEVVEDRYEIARLREVDVDSPQYQEYKSELYREVLKQLGISSLGASIIHHPHILTYKEEQEALAKDFEAYLAQECKEDPANEPVGDLEPDC